MHMREESGNEHKGVNYTPGNSCNVFTRDILEMYNDSRTCKIDSVRALQTMENMFQLKWSRQDAFRAKC